MGQFRFLIIVAAFCSMLSIAAQADPKSWEGEWPQTNFDKSLIDFKDILSGGPPKDGIPAIDNPVFLPVSDIQNLKPNEAVIALSVQGQARAYPLRVMMWHEIVNDKIAGLPVAVTYCPLCNAAIVFDRRLPSGDVVDFGTTGKLRHSDLVMYDRQTESWWQQFTGEAIVGDQVGTVLEMLPAALLSWRNFQERYPEGEVLVPADPALRDYGRNPYRGYSTLKTPFLYYGTTSIGVPPMALVVAVGEKAWLLSELKQKKRIEADGVILSWQEGQSIALEGSRVYEGEDVGTVTVEPEQPYHVTFAFAFNAFTPEGKFVVEGKIQPTVPVHKK